MRISDWSSDVCSSDLNGNAAGQNMLENRHEKPPPRAKRRCRQKSHRPYLIFQIQQLTWQWQQVFAAPTAKKQAIPSKTRLTPARRRSEEHTSELQSLMRISYAVFCSQQKTKQN